MGTEDIAMSPSKQDPTEQKDGSLTPGSSVFLTPRSSRIIGLSPTRSSSRQTDTTALTQLSPTKRGILNFAKGSPGISRATSPVKTPNGRAGLPSPQKRSIPDLDRSARKRAYKSSSVYSRLMDDEFEEDDYLNEQDKELAGRIIRESKKSQDKKDEIQDDLYERAYGSDVEFEEDVSESPKKGRGRKKKHETESIASKSTKRGRPIKTEQSSVSPNKERAKRAKIDTSKSRESPVGSGKRVRASQKLQDDDSDNDEEEEEEDDSVDIDSEDDSEEDEDVELDDSDEEVIMDEPRTPSKSKRRGKASATPTPRKVGRPRTREIREKRKVGRPSNADNVIRQVKSIFQMDDDTFFQENKSPQKATPKSPKKSAPVPSVNFNNTGDSTFSRIPVISGIADKKEEDHLRDDDSTDIRFTPMPLPQLDENGEIIDQEYVKKYFPHSSIETKYRTKLADERAFFLEGSEGYFEQHNTRVKSSVNSLSLLAPAIDYDEFIPFVRLSELVQSQERRNLNHLHKSLYHQWCFELTQSFNLNFYGVGSKVKLILDFVENYLIDWYEQVFDDKDYPQILVINGYNPATKLKTVMLDIALALISQETKKANNLKFPKHVSETVPFIIEFMNKHRVPHAKGEIVKPKLILAIHNIDGESLRDEKTQNLLSQLCALPEIWLISSVDNINVSLLWDSFRLKNYNFIWHDLTTYEPYSVELSFKDVLNMGKSKKFVGNKGAKYVLSSLTSNARKLYKLLLIKQLEVMKEATATKAGRAGLRANIKLAIGFKTIYTACLENFITSNEISFRTILGEFVEHKMCVLTKDDSGAEMVFIPFTYDESEQLLKEEFGSGDVLSGLQT